MPEGKGYGKNSKKKKNDKKHKPGGLFNFVSSFFTPKKGSLVDNMRKGVKGYQGGSMGKGGMGK